MTRIILLAIAMSLFATAANSDGISSNFIGRDVFGGVSFTGKITPPPACSPGASNGQLDFSVCSNIIYVPALIH
jgi:type 1 fimbria pilin